MKSEAKLLKLSFSHQASDEGGLVQALYLYFKHNELRTKQNKKAPPQTRGGRILAHQAGNCFLQPMKFLCCNTTNG